MEENDDRTSSPAPAPPHRYLKQPKSTHGKVAYVVYAGNDVGVFYNWTAASIAIFGLASSAKIYKGYSSYEGAHSAWEGFTNTGRLPPDVAASLGSKPYPKPPTPSARGISAPATTPQRVHVYNNRNASPLTPQTPLTPHRGRSAHTPLGSTSSHTYASAANHLNSVRPTPSPSTPRTPTSTQSRNAAAVAIAREESFRADQEDFWVVFTGTAPGVYQGREAGEHAFGQYENPSFLRTSAREHANQIFVDGYMELLVIRYVT